MRRVETGDWRLDWELGTGGSGGSEDVKAVE
jgi:hypothetical protein